MTTCKTCDGKGQFGEDRPTFCVDCGGTGQRNPGPPAYCRDPENCNGTCRRDIACNE